MSASIPSCSNTWLTVPVSVVEQSAATTAGSYWVDRSVPAIGIVNISGERILRCLSGSMGLEQVAEGNEQFVGSSR